MLHTRKQIIYRKRRYRCLNCQKVFSENHPFIARYCRIPFSDAAEVIFEHAQLISTCAIAEKHAISATTAARRFRIISADSSTLDEAISIDEFKGNVGEKFHFHAVRMANDALDTVRKEVQGKLGKENRKAFKHSRKFLLKREKTLMFRQATEKQDTLDRGAGRGYRRDD
ncbi:MAG: transposase [Schwartzia sp. (in: firmicutes)]